TDHAEIDGACGGGRPDGGEMLSSIHRARPSVSPAASARIIAVAAAGDTSKSIPLRPRNTRMGVKTAPTALDKGIGRTAPAGLAQRWNRLSRPLEEVFSRFHKRVIQDGALPLRCLWPHSDVIAACKQFVDRVKAERAVHFELLLGEELI